MFREGIEAPDFSEQTDSIPFSHRNFGCDAKKELLSPKESKVDCQFLGSHFRVKLDTVAIGD